MGDEMYKYAIIGFGGLGKKHLMNLLELEKERGDIHLHAICGADEATVKNSMNLNIGEVDLSSVDFSGCRFYQDYREMLDNEPLDFVLSTLPTFLHEEVAVYALKKGVHVFSEKPMALSAESCENMSRAAMSSGKYLMIGHSARFESAYEKLKEYVDKKTFGEPFRAEFFRYSQLPCWTWNNWILDPKQSGGCALDMHIHDVDLINWFFGLPKALESAVTERKAGLESVFTHYFYDNLLVVSGADWAMPQSFLFEKRCMVNFEKATVVIKDGTMTVYQDEDSFSPVLDAEPSHMREIRAFLKCIIDGEGLENISPESAGESVKLVLKEVEAAKTGGRMYL